MKKIQVEHQPDSEKLDKIGLWQWPIWIIFYITV